MENSALIEAIKSLSVWETNNFRRWLHSPAFSVRPEHARLFDYFVSCLAKKTQPDARKAAAELGLTGDCDKKLRYEMAGLLDVLRNFLIWQEMNAEPCQRELYLLRAVRRRGLEKNFALAEREIEKAMGKTSEASLERYRIDFQLNQEKYEWNMRQKRGQNFPFERLSKSLNAWYAGQLMQLACMDKAQGAVQRQERSAAMPDWTFPVLAHLPGRPHENLPAVALYHLGHEMLSHPEDLERVAVFREILKKNAAKLPPQEAKGLLMLAINHGIRRINEGDRRAIQTTLDFYLLGLESKLLQDERGILSRYTYNNVLMSFVALEEWDQALQFLEKYRLELAAAERENVYQYNLSIFHFRRGDYDTTLDLLRNVTFADPMYNLESRKMLLKIYFEQNAIGPLESLLENMLTWLRRHPEIGYHREMYRNLARFTGRLLRIPTNDKEARKRLEAKVRETPLVAEREWLLQKMKG
ncbi:MAG: tetratricopeptide repeat protein [Saprospiraceae bacterium]